jgi:hypothetical protein
MAMAASISEQVENVKSLELSYRVLHPKATLTDENSGRCIEFSFSSLTNKYKDFLSNIVIETELNDELQNKYRYKPKMVSMDLYGTCEFWNDILILNDCFSTYEFKPEKLKAYDPTRFKEYLNEILILEDLV